MSPCAIRRAQSCSRISLRKTTAVFKLAITVARMPKPRLGRILRGTIKMMADGNPWTMPATIDDPAISDEIGSTMKGKNVGVRVA